MGSWRLVAQGRLGVKSGQGFFPYAKPDPGWDEGPVKLETRDRIAIAWLDNPPAANRLIGLLWLGKLLYPAAFPQDIRAEARRFYALFYQQEPSDAQLDGLFANPPA